MIILIFVYWYLEVLYKNYTRSKRWNSILKRKRNSKSKQNVLPLEIYWTKWTLQFLMLLKTDERAPPCLKETVDHSWKIFLTFRQYWDIYLLICKNYIQKIYIVKSPHLWCYLIAMKPGKEDLDGDPNTLSNDTVACNTNPTRI